MEAASKILEQLDNIVKVASFTVEGIVYDVLTDVEENYLVSCTCPDQQASNGPCKHMFLVHYRRVTLASVVKSYFVS